MKRRRGAPRSFEILRAGDAIKRVLHVHGIADQVRAGRLLTEWTDLVGLRIAQRTRPEGIFERVLVIEVASSAWLHELNLLRPQIQANLVERLGEPKLFDEIKFRLAGRSRRESIVPPRPRPPQPPAKPSGPPATGAAREQIVRDVEQIDDAELRELIARVRITHNR